MAEPAGVDVARLVGELYAVEPGEFVATRKRLAAELKAAGEKEAAATFVKLRKPTVLEHALNETARSDPEVVDAWASAVDAVGAAQSAAIGGGAAGPLREATATLRAATSALVRAATQHAGAAKAGELATFLAGLATPTGTSSLRRGVLGSADPDVGHELFAGAPNPPERPSAPATPTQAAARAGGRRKRAGTPAAPPADVGHPAEVHPTSAGAPATGRGPSKQALRRHAADVDKASRARDTAEREVERLRRELARAQDRLDAAARALAHLESSAPT